MHLFTVVRFNQRHTIKSTADVPNSLQPQTLQLLQQARSTQEALSGVPNLSRELASKSRRHIGFEAVFLKQLTRTAT